MATSRTKTRRRAAQLGHRASRVAQNYYDVPFLWLRSRSLARRYRAALASVDTFCLFVGHARSGHSIVGATLDAHPSVVTAHEADALRWIRAHLSRQQVFALLLEHERAHNEAGRPGPYDYRVPGQWQGRYERLTVIGDKHGPAAARRLTVQPELVDRVRDLGVRLRMIYVVRNPFDNISTRAERMKIDLERAMSGYFMRCHQVDAIESRLSSDEFIVVRHEDFVAETEKTVQQLCTFLGVEADPEYLRACASIVYDRPHHSRDDAPWTDELIDEVNVRMTRFASLAGYRFDE